MDPRFLQEQIGLFPANPRRPTEVELLRAEAVRARDAAIGQALRGAGRAVWQVLTAVAEALVTFPARRGTYEQLRQLSDRELADIGLARGDIARVFEPDFRLPAQAANANQPAPVAAKPQAA